MSEYEELGHMIRVIPLSLRDSAHPVCYLPHHGVLKEKSITTKLRVVSNGSSPTSSGLSVTDFMHTEANLSLEIFDIVL